LSSALTTGKRGGFADSELSGPAARMRPYLAAGVAVLGASLIAANPVAPNISADIQERAVRLAGSVTSDIADVTTNAATAAAAAATNPITLWSDVLTTALNNTETLASDWLADPFPIMAQVIHNQLGFAQTIGGSLQSMNSTLLNVITQELPGQFQTMVNGIAAGDIGASVTNFNDSLLLDLLPTIFPLETILKVPGEMATNFSTVVSQYLPQLAIDLLVPALALYAGTTDAVAYGVQDVVEAWDAGQPGQALIDAVNLPAIYTDALLNGFSPPAGLGTTGLLGTPGGVVDSLFISLPQQIAQTLAGGYGAQTATLAGDLSELGQMIFGGLSGALNPGAFTAAFDPGAFAAAFDPTALSMAFDPSAVTDIGSMLAADLAPNLSGIVMDLMSMF